MPDGSCRKKVEDMAFSIFKLTGALEVLNNPKGTNEERTKEIIEFLEQAIDGIEVTRDKGGLTEEEFDALSGPLGDLHRRLVDPDIIVQPNEAAYILRLSQATTIQKLIDATIRCSRD